MRPRSLFPVLLLGVGLLTPALVRVRAAENAEAARVAKLVDQLGSGDFAERERASKDLDDIGAPALEALHRATASEDAEVRRRADDLIRKIERRTASARILAPTRVHLVYKDNPLPEAVADFGKKSGYEIVLHDPKGKLAGRKVTLDTGETTFWHAVDLFCREAGARQAGAQDLVPAPGPALPGAFPPNQPQFGGGGRGGRAQAPPQPALPGAAQPGVVVRRGGGHMLVGQVASEIILIEGRPRALPVDDTRAVRVRAVDNAFGQAPEGQALLSLEIAPEPKLQWQQLDSVRVVRATDDQGQELSQVSDATVAPAFGVIGGGRARRAGVVFAQQAVVGGPAVVWGGAYPQTLVRLRKGEKPAKSLKELTGLLGALVLTEPRPVLAADNVLQAAGKTFKGKEGGSITVNEVVKGDDGKVTIRYQMRQPPDVLPAGNPNPGARRAVAVPMPGVPMPVGGAPVQVQIIQAQIQLARQARVQVQIGPGGGGILTPNNGVSLVGPRGEVLPTSTTVNLRQNGAALEPEYELVYRPRKGQGEPARLVFFGRKSAAIDIPFTLKDVPLP